MPQLRLREADHRSPSPGGDPGLGRPILSGATSGAAGAGPPGRRRLASLWSAFRYTLNGLRPPADPSRREPISFRLLVLLLILFAAGVRFLRCKEGLPYLHFWDEPQTATTALRMMQKGEYNPEFFNYGSATIYLNLFVDILNFFRLMGQPETSGEFLNKLSDIKTSFDTGWHWTISHPSFYFWDRVLTAAMGTATVLVTYLLGRRVAGRWAGFLAAALLAGLEVHIQHSAMITTDAPVAFFVILTALLSVLFLERGKPVWLVWALVTSGLAASTKYNSALCVAIPLLALIFAAVSGSPGYRRWLWIALPLAPACAFAAGTPYAVIEFHKFLRDAGGEIRHYNVTGHGSSTIRPGLTHLLFQARTMWQNLGLTASVLSAAGALFFAARRVGWILLVFPAAYVTFMTSTKVSFHRNFIVIYPFAALAFAAGAVLAFRFIREATAERPIVGRTAVAAFVVLTGAILVQGGWAAAGAGWETWTTAETRTEAMSRLDALVAPGWKDAKIGIAEELRIHDSDLKRVKIPYVILPYLDLLCDAGRYAAIVGAKKYFAYDLAQGPTALMMSEARPQRFPILASIGQGNPLYVDTISINPAIQILGPPRGEEAAAPDACVEKIAPKDLEMSRPYDVDPNSVLQMLQGGDVATQMVFVPAGSYAYSFRARGTWARGVYSKLKVAAEDHLAEGGPYWLAGKTYELNAKPTRYVLKFQAADDTLVRLKIEFINDFWDPAVKEDRNVYLDSIFLLRLEPAGS